MIRELIRREFGVRLSEVSVGRLLRKLGLSPQRPLYRAYQQNPEAVARWKAEEYPRSAPRRPRWAPRSTSPTRPGCARTTMPGTTWAPVGRTPVVATTGDRFGVNLISAVTAKGKLRFAAYDGNLNGRCSSTSAVGCSTTAPVRCFWSWTAIRCTAPRPSRQFAAATKGRLRLFFLPGYAPELNPDEWVWKNVKHDRIGRAGVTGPEDLKAKALAALHRLQKLPDWSAASSGIRTCVTSPPDQSTYLLSPW